MWKQIFDYAKEIVFLTRETQENKSDIKEQKSEIKEIRAEVKQLRTDFNNLVLLVQQFSFDIQNVSNREEAEREKLVLRLENEMLKFERRLPQGKDTENK